MDTNKKYLIVFGIIAIVIVTTAASFALSIEIGLSKGTPTSWKRANRIPHAAQLQKIADYFGITVDELYGEETKKGQPTTQMDDELSEKRKALMDFAMSVPEDKAEMILQVMKTILQND